MFVLLIVFVDWGVFLGVWFCLVFVVWFFRFGNVLCWFEVCVSCGVLCCLFFFGVFV